MASNAKLGRGVLTSTCHRKASNNRYHLLQSLTEDEIPPSSSPSRTGNFKETGEESAESLEALREEISTVQDQLKVTADNFQKLNNILEIARMTHETGAGAGPGAVPAQDPTQVDGITAIMAMLTKGFADTSEKFDEVNKNIGNLGDRVTQLENKGEKSKTGQSGTRHHRSR